MQKEINSDYLRGNIDTIILKTLFNGEKYGYEICKDIETKSNGSFILKQPSLYSALKRLEATGLISSRWQDSEIGGKRHYYTLTELGIEKYTALKTDWDYSATVLSNLISDGNKNSQKEDIPQQNQTITSTENNQITQSEIKKEENPESEDNVIQQDFFYNAPLSNLDEPIELPNIEPEKENDLNFDLSQAENHEKNDAQFINETYVDENDISFSNDVFLRVKNSIKPTTSQGEVDYAENETISPMNYFAPPKEKQVVKKSAKIDLSSYSIKPYTKYNKNLKKYEFLKSNKLNLYLSLITYLIVLAESIGLYLILNSRNALIQNSKIIFIILVLIASLYPIINIIKSIINPYKKSICPTKNKLINKLIWFCSLSFMIIIINILIDVNCFSNNFALTTMLYPIILLSNIIINEAIFRLMLKSNIYKA